MRKAEDVRGWASTETVDETKRKVIEIGALIEIGAEYRWELRAARSQHSLNAGAVGSDDAFVASVKGLISPNSRILARGLRNPRTGSTSSLTAMSWYLFLALYLTQLCRCSKV